MRKDRDPLSATASLRGVCLAASAALLLANGQLVEATPESRATALFLLISPSVRVNGMGQAGVALADEPASYYNPAATAFSSPGHTFQSRFYLSGMPWLPAFADDMTYSHHAAQISGGGELDNSSWWKPTRFRAAFYGYRTKMDMDFGSFTSVETSDNVGVSLALRSVVEVGIGAISKRISSRLGDIKGAADAYDFGFMAVLPMTEAFKRLTGRELSLNYRLRPRLNLGFGLSWQNRGGRMFQDPLPAHRRHGWSAVLTIDRSSDSLGIPLSRVTFSTETYRPQVEGAKAASRAEDDKTGIEISILETVSFRWGKYDDFDGQVHLKTSGRTIQSDGLFQYVAGHLKHQPPGSMRDGLLFLLRRLSISRSWFTYDPEWPARGHSYIGLSF